MSNLKDTNLEVTKFAIDEVKNVIEYKNNDCNNATIDKKYKTIAKKMPVLIQSNGLIGTLAFLYSKLNNENSHKIILDNIIIWCKYNSKLKGIIKLDEIEINKKSDLINRVELKESTTSNSSASNVYATFLTKITALDSQTYKLVTKEIIILFCWIKRFVDGMILENQD